ncbi:g9410 [Coccomyxa viridis]|uniref:G9410 protein n=1 Tax=Coccomyxa viridis TaxID=1274662 RepID=A0ABP1G2Y8_9CHLO
MWIVFPVSLFETLDSAMQGETLCIVEDPVYWGHREHMYTFNRLKMVYMRATCLYYRDFLQRQGLSVRLIDYRDVDAFYAALDRNDKVHVHDPTDFFLEQKLRKVCRAAGTTLHLHPTPNFLTTRNDIDSFLTVSGGKFMHSSFYQWQRRRLDVLMTAEGEPVGGRWSFDDENRKRVPPGTDVPQLQQLSRIDAGYVDTARKYIDRHQEFGNNPGGRVIVMPVSHAGARARFKVFLARMLHGFGDYEDAIVRDNPFLYHTVLSGCLNVGLLDPGWMIRELCSANAPINCVEGLVRQIIGFREYTRMMYITQHDFLSTTNFLEHYAKVPPAFYSGGTGLMPLDDAIGQAWRLGYLSHIPRLMVVGSAMTMLGISPAEMYKWFLEFSIDAYPWVMLSNISMASFCDGGKFFTKPYVSGSNYILKMSDYKADGHWDRVWNAMYFSFFRRHAKKLRGSRQTAFAIANLKRRAPSEVAEMDRLVRDVKKHLHIKMSA